MTGEIFLTQSDPMKVLPPADDQVIGNEYGTVFMNAKTAHKLMALQSVRNETLGQVLEVIDNTICTVSLSGIDRDLIMLGTLLELKDKFLAMKGGEQV